MISGEKCCQIYRRIVGEAVIEAKILASGGRPMLVLYGAQDGITPVPNVLSLRDELGDQVRAHVRIASSSVSSSLPQDSV